MFDKLRSLFLIVICVANVALMLVNNQMQRWQPKSAQETKVVEKKYSAASIAFRLGAQNGVLFEWKNGEGGEMYTRNATSISRVNRWLEQLAVQRIIPTTLWLRAAPGEADVIIEKTGF